jgi:hypothetical protein
LTSLPVLPSDRSLFDSGPSTLRGQREQRLVKAESVVPALVRSLLSCIVKGSSCRCAMLRQEVLAFIKALSTLLFSPAILREVRTAMSQRKKKTVLLAWCRGATSGGGARAPIDYLVSSRESVKPKSRQARGSHSSPPTEAHCLAMGPRLCPRMQRQRRENKLLSAGGNSGLSREGLRTRLCWPRPLPRLATKPTAMCSDPSESALIRDVQ